MLGLTVPPTLLALTVRPAVPTIYQDREFAAAGGLMSYGTRGASMRIAPHLSCYLRSLIELMILFATP
jgi:hypothetical protein